MRSTSTLAYVVLSLILGYAFIYSPMGEVEALSAQKGQYNDSLEKAQKIESKTVELLTQFNNISPEDKELVDTILPDSLDFVRLVSQIDAVASKYGISIDSVTSQNTSDSSSETSPVNGYNSAVIGFSFKAPYDNFRTFMDDLEKSLRIMDAKSVSISPAKEGSIYEYQVSFQTYWLPKQN